MARIPQAELDRLKREVSIAELAEAQGLKLRRNGKTAIGLCPFHEDHDPSLHIDLEKNLWRCFGCDQGGTVIDWVMKTHGASFRHAVEILWETTGVSPVAEGEPVGGSSLACPLDLEADDGTLTRQVIEYYHGALPRNPSALAFLERRGVAFQEAIDTFKLGFSDRTLGLRLPSSKVKAGQQIRARLQEIGITKKSGHETFRGSVVFPVIDGAGKVTEIYGRKISDDVRPGTPLHMYLEGPHRGVWNLAALRDSREIILCESIIDALTFWCSGFQNVTCSYGTNGFTRDHLEAMKAYGTARVLIAYDRDESGDTAAKALAEKLGAEGIGCYRVLFPRGMDANEYALKMKPPSRALGVLLGCAEWMSGPMSDRVTAPPSAPASPAPPAPAPPEEAGEQLSSLAAKQPPSAPAPAAAPPAPEEDTPAEVSEHEVVIRLDGLRWRVRGLGRNTSVEQLKVNLMVTREADGDRFHVDTLDMYSSRHRDSYIRKATAELGCKEQKVKDHLGKVFRKLEQLQHERLTEALKPKENTVQLNAGERREAMKLLEDPRLLDRIAEDLERCGLVGEQINKMVSYLAAVSRKLERPLGVLIQSSSAAGKSALMNAVLDMMPEEERVQYSAMTGQSLYYLGETDLKHKVLAIAEEEGADRASYALKLLLSEAKLSIASTGKDGTTGQLKTHKYKVEGPVALLTTSTAIDIDEELMNRCLVLSVDESREQTEAIHRRQRLSHTLKGLELRMERSDLLRQHQNAQRLLRPLHVHNPYSEDLTFLNEKTRTRRDNEKYLTLIDAIALLHQHQREVKRGVIRGREVDYVEAFISDIAIANHLANEALGRTLDELPPQTRRFLDLIHEWVCHQCEELELVQAAFRFSRRQIREATRWSYDQVRIHMARLVDLEYVLVHRGKRGQSFEYELLWDGRGTEGERFFIGLIDVETLQQKAKSGGTLRSLGGSERGLEGSEAEFGVPLDPHLTPFGPPLEGAENGRKSNYQEACDDSTKKSRKNAQGGAKKQRPSYGREGRTPAPALAAKARGTER